MNTSDVIAPYYEVRVADNFWYRDKEKECSAGIFSSADAAIEKCRAIVDICLEENRDGGKSPEQIFAGYRYSGDDPFIVAHNGAPSVMFSAWDYAERRAADLA
jgi:hypothetical protein